MNKSKAAEPTGMCIMLTAGVGRPEGH